MRILLNETAAVIIDIQERLLPHMHENQIILQNNLKLIDGLQILSIPTVITQQYTRGLGETVPSIVSKFPEFRYIEKISFSCIDEPGFKEQVSLLGKPNIILCGIEAHVCVLQTCLDLLDAGFRPVIIEDCVSSRKLNDKKVAIERMRQEGARISTMESLLFELVRSADSKYFKDISRIVK
jgi:nicotinamidase-related amidase